MRIFGFQRRVIIHVTGLLRTEQKGKELGYFFLVTAGWLFEKKC